MSIVSRRNSSFVLLNDLDSANEKQKIKVQIIVLWKANKNAAGITLEMVMVDEEGTRIHAQVEEDMSRPHQKFLKEGQAVIINAFQLKDYLGEFRTNPYPYKIGFFRTTKVKPADHFPETIPNKYFADFDDIVSGKLDKNVLVDVIGQIVNVGPLEQLKTKGQNNTKVDIVLRDAMNVHLTCTLWSSFAKKVTEYTEMNNESVVICVVNFACIKEYKGNFSISNAFNATQIFFNPETAEVKKFMSMLPGDNQMIVHSENSQVSFGSVSVHDEIFVINPKKTISGILDTRRVGKFVVVATIDSIDLAKKWYYVACKACKKKVQPYGDDSDDEDQNRPLYNCEKCDDVFDIIYCFYLVLRVSDESAGETKFLLFNKTAEKLTGRHASDLVNEAAEQDASFMPQALTDLIGKKFLFKITIGSDNKKGSNSPYVVELVVDDAVMIEEFEAQPIPQSPVVMFSHHEIEPYESYSTTPSSKRKEEFSSPLSITDQNSSTKKQKKVIVKVEKLKNK